MTDTELIARLEKLERDNRRLKRLGAAALALVGALGLIASARPVPIPNVIRAHKFEVVNSAGKVGMRLEATSDGAVIAIALQPTVEGSNLQGASVSIGTFGKHSWVSLGTAAWSGSPGSQQWEGMISALSLNNRSSKGPQIVLSDDRGYTMSLGSTSLLTPQTGEAHQTSADSIVMFGNAKDHHVIWQAP